MAGTASAGFPVISEIPRDRVLRCERDGAVAVLRLDRPDSRNALDSRLVDRLVSTLTELDGDAGVRAVVLGGSPPGFCSGSDLRELAGLTPEAMAAHEARTGHAARVVQQLGIPVVAAVEGFAIGGGYLLAASCDVVVSADDARWQLPEVRLGWVPPWGLHALVGRVGPARARRLAWGGASPSARELHRLGVVDELARPGDALRRARAVAVELAALPPHAVASTKQALFCATAAGAESTDVATTARFGADVRTAAAQARLDGYRRRTA